MKNKLETLLQSRRSALVVGLIVGATAVLAAFGFLKPDSTSEAEHIHHESKAEESTVWTCAMHPQVQQPSPGKCPICGMNLIPLAKGGSVQGNSRQLTLSQEAKTLIKVRSTPVRKGFAEKQIRMVGKITYDERGVKSIAARFPARIERLYVDYTGLKVQQGDHLAEVYSPELLTAQSELQTALKYGATSLAVDAAREKLRLWGFSEEKIAEIERGAAPSEKLDINSPLTGTVVEKMMKEGQYLEVGSDLFKIADLSRVWVLLDAYESDIAWIRYGQQVQFEVEAYPGEHFNGTVAFISPELDSESRTIKVRVNASNPGERLKPGMFVRAVVSSILSKGGVVAGNEFRGKWISPMHPEIVKDAPGMCDICGMPLLPAEELGYVSERGLETPLLVPASAVLQTGKRAIVYVTVKDAEEPTYEGREITLGARAGEDFIVQDGLLEGEEVVVNGNFKIDSALQILARPSMMSAPQQVAVDHQAGQEGRLGKTVVPKSFLQQIDVALEGYFAAEKMLVEDDFAGARQQGNVLLTSLKAVNMALLTDTTTHESWMLFAGELASAADALSQSTEINQARVAFETLSRTFKGVLKTFGTTENREVYQMYCPMAFDGNRRADWLQADAELHNPYLGSAMPKCGVSEGKLQ